MSVGDSCIPWDLRLIDEFSISITSTNRMALANVNLELLFAVFILFSLFLLLAILLSVESDQFFFFKKKMRLSLQFTPIRSFINN